MALRNEANYVSGLVQSLFSQCYPPEKLQFVFVDDHSEDHTFQLLEKAIASYPTIQSNVLKAENSGKKAALHQALKSVSAELIVVTDADCRHSPYWIAQLVASFKENDPVMLLGPVKILPAKSFFEKLQSLEFLSLIASTAGAVGIGMPSMANGANMAFKREALVQAGGFNQKIKYASGDDVFLMLMLLRLYGAAKLRFVLSENAIVTTTAQPNLKSFLNQRKRWVSKSKAYRHPFIVLPALVVFLFSMSMVLLLLAAVVYPYLLLMYVLFVFLKYLVDLPLLKAAASFMNSRPLLRWAFALQLIYPLYVTITAFFGLIYLITSAMTCGCSFFRRDIKSRSFASSRNLKADSASRFSILLISSSAFSSPKVSVISFLARFFPP